MVPSTLNGTPCTRKEMHTILGYIPKSLSKHYNIMTAINYVQICIVLGDLQLC